MNYTQIGILSLLLFNIGKGQKKMASVGLKEGFWVVGRENHESLIFFGGSGSLLALLFSFWRRLRG